MEEESCVHFLAGSPICLPMSEEGQDYKRSLATKGTTFIIAYKGDHFLFAIDSKESYRHQHTIYLLNEKHEKYIWLADRKVFAVYAGDCRIGKAFFAHLKATDETGDTLEEVVKTGARFSYPGLEDIDADHTDIFVGGWLENGRGELFKLTVKFSDLNLQYSTTFKSLNLAQRNDDDDWFTIFIGSGKKYIQDYLAKEMKPHHTLDQRKSIMRQLSTVSAMKDPTTGGYIAVGNPQRGLIASDCEEQSVRESLINHFDYAYGKCLKSVFLVYEKNTLNESDFASWLGSFGNLRRYHIVVQSTMLKFKDSEYFLRSIELSPNLKNVLKVEGKEIERTTDLKTLLGDHGFLEYKYAGRFLYIGDWSQPFLEMVEQESNLNEESLLPEECYDL